MISRVVLTGFSAATAAVAMMGSVSGSGGAGEGGGSPGTLYQPIVEYLEARRKEFGLIPEDRRETLGAMSRFLNDGRGTDRPARVVFVCTHNSRRSQMAQVWAAAAAQACGVRVSAYSGGTQATAFNPRAVEAMRRAGFRIDKTTDDENAVYHVHLGASLRPVTCFSKTIGDPPNPTEGFAAVMVCGQADKACPSVAGALERFVMPVEDPKAADGTPGEAAVYDERCAQIAREMLYVMSGAIAPPPPPEYPPSASPGPTGRRDGSR